MRVVKNRDGYFFVVAMTPSCQLHKYGIEVGMEFLSVNNISCNTLPDEAAFFETLHLCSADKPKSDDIEKKHTLGLTTLLVHPAPASTKQYIPSPGTFVTAVIEKEAATTRVGLMVVQEQEQVPGAVFNDGKLHPSPKTKSEETTEYGKVMIKEIAPDALASNTILRPGMQLISINNTLCVHKGESAALLRHLTGTITLLAQVPTAVPPPIAHHVTATIYTRMSAKEREDATQERDNLGLALSDTYKDKKEGIYITGIDPKGPFADSKLRVGMQLVSVNNVEIDGLELAQALFSKGQVSQRIMTVLAKQTCQSVIPGTLVTATAIKTNADSKLGLMVSMDHNTMPVIQYIREGGLMEKACDEHAPLEPGMIIHKINNTPTKGLKTKEQVSQLLQKTTPQGILTILAEAPTSSLAGSTSSTPAVTLDSLKTLTIIQRLPEQSLGWSLGLPKAQQGRIVVTDVEDGGLAMKSGVKRGTLLFKIDNVFLPCTYKTVAEADAAVSDLFHKVAPGIPCTLLVQEETPTTLIPPILTGAIVKETKQSKVGIRLRTHKERVAIISLAEGSVSSATDLMGGMLIRSINNISCTSKNPEEVAQLLADAIGVITIVAETPDCPLSEDTLASMVTTAVSKADREGTSDIEKCFTFEEGKVWISEEGVKGLFHGSAFRIGMEVMSLNNVPYEILTPSGIRGMMENGDLDYITILAKKPKLPPGLIMTEVLRKEEASDKFGLDCTASKGLRSKVIISKIKDGSSASVSRLLEGMEVLAVNNADTSRVDAHGAAEILSREAATGCVTYVAGVSSKSFPLHHREFVSANLEMDKVAKDCPIGITVFRNHYGKIVIGSIQEKSLAADTKLEEGMEIMAVNNAACQNMKALDVQALLSSTDGPKIKLILAEKLPEIQGKVVIASMVKTSPDMRVGVTMREVRGRVIIKVISPDSICANTELGKGMWIKSINNKDVSGATTKQVADMLKAEMSVITVLAETTLTTDEELGLIMPEPEETAEAAASDGGAAEVDGEAQTLAVSDDNTEGSAAENAEDYAAKSGGSSAAESGEDSADEEWEDTTPHAAAEAKED